MHHALALLALTAASTDAPTRTSVATEFLLECDSIEVQYEGVWTSLAEMLGGGEWTFQATGQRAAAWSDRWTQPADEPARLTRTFDELTSSYGVTLGFGEYVDEDETLVMKSPLVGHPITCVPSADEPEFEFAGDDPPAERWLEGLELHPAAIPWATREAPAGGSRWYGTAADALLALRPLGRPALEVELGSTEYAEIVLLLAWAADPLEHLSFEDVRLLGEAGDRTHVPLELSLEEEVDLLPFFEQLVERMQLEDVWLPDEMEVRVNWTGEGVLEQVADDEARPFWRLHLEAELQVDVNFVFGDMPVRCVLDGSLEQTQTWQ